MATGHQFNSKSPTIRRILKEASELSTSPSPDYTATPLDDNLFEWHFTLRGPPGGSTAPDSKGPYHDGIYHGRIVLPPSYPLRPPSFRFLTPSGRFETNREICLSISGHHEETWQPAWGLRTALVALRTFMETDPKGQLGGLECTDDVRIRMAKASQAWKCSSCGKSNLEILNECEEAAKKLDSTKIKQVVIPEGLKMGWKDEMRPTTSGPSSSKDTTIDSNKDTEIQELAEGFVPTTPSQAHSQQEPSYPPARPAQSVPHPTPTVPLPATSAPAPPNQPPVALAQLQGRSNAGVPEWVDRAILGIAACLAVMVLKIVLGL